MLLTIYNKNGAVRMEVAANDSSTQQKGIQGNNVLTLSFTYYEYLTLDVNDYVDFEGDRYWLIEKYAPAQKSKSEWVYDIKLYGIESIIRRFLVLETTDGNSEPVFTLTAPPREHVAMIVKCINDGMSHTSDWKVGQVDGTENIVIDYEGKYCDDALKEVAEKVGNGAEWWVEGQTVNVCRCEHGEEIMLGYGRGLTSLDRDTDSQAKFYTRLFPIGSSRNIDPEKYGHSRLMLPGGRQYVELHVDEYGIYDHYEKDAFAHVFPRRIGTVSSVRAEEAKDDSGNAFTVYYFKDDAMDFDPNSYELAGETKRVSFQDGELNGLGTGDDHYFEVDYDSESREFKIVTIWPYEDDTQLPGGQLVPKAGDSYLLWNIRMPDEYYPLAEKELLDSVEQYNADNWRDISVYKGSTDYVWIEDNKADLFVGRRVRLESDKYFPETGYRNSRITKITRKVNLPSQMDIEISDALQKEVLDKINDSIAEVRQYAKNAAAGQLPDIIRTGDGTQPTDNNLFSARRSQREFISRMRDDTVQGVIDFMKKTLWGKFSAETGAAMTVDEKTGQTFLEIDRLKVRLKAFFEQLEVQKVSYSGGKLVFTKGQGVNILHVDEIKDEEDVTTAYRCYFLGEQEGVKIDNLLQVDDQVQCRTDNIRAGSSAGASNKYYWRLVSAVSSETVKVGNDVCHWVDLSPTDCDEGSDIPEAGDTICHLGNRTDTDRQAAIIISVIDANSPSMTFYQGIDSYSLKDRDFADFGYEPSTKKFYTKVYGDFYYGDRESKEGDKHYIKYTTDGGLEISGKLTINSAVGDTTLGDIADNAEKGAVLVTITTDKGNVIFNGEGTRTLTAHVLKRNEDITDTIEPALFSWERTSNDTQDDSIWNKLHRGIGNVCVVSEEDVVRSALITCVVDLED